MKERPIIFNGEMVKAILNGRKTQTRRVIKPQPIYNRAGLLSYKGHCSGGCQFMTQLNPYGQPGDRLWVRETWGYSGYNRIEYKAFPKDGKDFRSVTDWKPSIHMPRWASRITLEIVDVRVERLQDISEEAAQSEGMVPKWSDGIPIVHDGSGAICIEEFCKTWNTIHGPGAWDKNPLVWVIEFKKEECNGSVSV